MAIKGSLKEASLADVCQLLALGAKTGSLSVSDRSNFGQIFFDRGKITFARIVNRRDRIGDLLVRDRVLTHEQLSAAIDEQAKRPDVRLGQLLVERAHLSSEDLDRYIRRQIEEAVYYLFTWTRGTFFFEADKAPEDADILVSINPENLLLEGARRIDEWSQIEKKIPSFDLIFEVDRVHLEASDVELTPEQERILAALDGSRTLHDLVDETGLVEFEIGKALFGLIQAGFAHQVGRRGPATSPRLRDSETTEHRNLGVAFYRTGMFDEASREFEKALELQPDDITSRFHQALIAIRLGQLRDAVAKLKELVERFGSSAEVFGNMAYALLRLGRAGDALLALQQAESLLPDAPQLALLRSMCELERGNPSAAELALDEYRRRLNDAQPGPVYYHYHALAAALEGDLAKAKRRTDEGLDAHPDAAALLVLAGVIAERGGDLDDAEQLIRRAMEEDPTLPQAHKNLGDIAYRRGLHDDALTHYERTVELDADLGDDVWTKLGNIRFKRTEHDEAVACWKRALELNPDNRVVRTNLDVATHAGG